MEKKSNHITENLLQESTSLYGFVHLSEDEKLLIDAKRPGIEKLQLFTRMLKRNTTVDKFKTQSLGTTK
jgi:hypothetical protein